MEGKPVRQSIIDYFTQPPRSKKIGSTPSAAKKSKSQRSLKSKLAIAGHFWLLPEDGIACSWSLGSFCAQPSCESQGPAKAKRYIERSLRKVFSSIWQRIPWRDRARMLTYWHDPRQCVFAADHSEIAHRPITMISDYFEESGNPRICRNLGHVLMFSRSLIQHDAARLQPTIIEALAAVFRYASGEHDRLVCKLLEQYRTWELRHGKQANDDTRDSELDRVDQEFSFQHERETADLVRRWGFQEPAGK